MIKKILKWLGLIVLVLLLGCIGTGIYLNEPRPTENPSPEADALAQQMLEAVNQSAWDSTQYVAFTFRGNHHYLWDKWNNVVEVSWKENKVLLRLEDQTGLAWKKGEPVKAALLETMLEKAYSKFCNDSFWFNAIVKAFDPGTTRSLVTLKDGREGLMVSYASGGVTPGDAYVWLLDENHRPTSWKMWVNILPVGGLEVSWEDYEPLPTGALVARNHEMLGRSVPLTNVKGGHSLEAVGAEANLFAPLLLSGQE